MKKYCCVAFLIILSGCRNPDASPVPEELDQAETIVTMTLKANTSETSTPMPIEIIGEITVDPGMTNVEITIPASMFGSTDMSTFDIEKYTNDNGFRNAVLNANGSITVTMSKSRHTELIDEMAHSINKSFDELTAETAYITGITANTDFTKVTVDVDRAGYEAAFDVTPLAIAMNVGFYQILAGKEQGLEIIIRDIY